MSGKRKAEEDVIPAQSYTRIKLASPSPEKSGSSDTESILSCQGYETEFVKDTSDTSSSPTYNIEYDITDAEEPRNKFYLSDDSDDEDIVELDSIFGPKSCDSLDIALLGDTSEENSTSPTSNSDVDPGLPRNDYLDFEKCLLCQTDKKNISYPYCSACFKWKKNFFPSRPKKINTTSKKDAAEPLNSIERIKNSSLQIKITTNFMKNERDAEINEEESENISELELGKKQIGFNELDNQNHIIATGDRVENNSVSEVLCEDSGIGSSNPQLSEDVVDTPSQEPSTSTSTSSATNSRRLSLDICRVCFLKPENGLFVHLNSAHIYGCYSCAKKIWYYNGGCPICRRKIFKVAKLFV